MNKHLMFNEMPLLKSLNMAVFLIFPKAFLLLFLNFF